MRSVWQAVMIPITILLVVLGSAAAATAYVLVRVELTSFQDNALQEVALNAGLIYRHDIQPRIDAELEDQLVVQIWDTQGNLVHRSGPPADIPHMEQVGYFDVRAASFEWRVYASRDSVHFIQVSQRWSAREEVAMFAAGGAVLPIVIAIPIAWLSIGWSVRRVTSRLTEVSVDISRRSIDSKTHIGAADLPTEIAALVTSMNSLIDRHQDALNAQRRFVADAAHELRTPLAALQIQVDNLVERPMDDQTAEAANEVLSGVRRSSYLVNQLLTVARADASTEARPERAELAPLIHLVAGEIAPLANVRNVCINIDVETEIAIVTRLSDLALVLTNVLDNAVRYSPEHGCVTITARTDGGRTVVEIIDGGCGIPEESLPFVFDRFFRVDPAASEGSGLGLAIAKVSADRANIALSICNRADGSGIIAALRLNRTISQDA